MCRYFKHYLFAGKVYECILILALSRPQFRLAKRNWYISCLAQKLLLILFYLKTISAFALFSVWLHTLKCLITEVPTSPFHLFMRDVSDLTRLQVPTAVCRLLITLLTKLRASVPCRIRMKMCNSLIFWNPHNLSMVTFLAQILTLGNLATC